MGLARRQAWRCSVSHSPGVASLDRIEAILRNDAIYRLAELIPAPARQHGGRPRDYPNYMLLVFDALLGVYRTGRQVEAELSHPLTWRFMRRLVRRRFPNQPSRHLPSRPMQRHHYLYGRNRYLSCPEVLEALGRLHREIA